MRWHFFGSLFRAAGLAAGLTLACTLGFGQANNDAQSQGAPQNKDNANSVNAGAVAAQEAAAPIGSSGAIRSNAVTLAGGDLISVKVFGADDLSQQQQRVRASGDIYLPLIGNVQVKGLTPEQAQHSIEDKLRDGGFLRDPHVSILVKEYATAGVSVGGEVKNPGIYPLIGNHRLFDALSAAGGMTQTAGNDVVITHKADPEHPDHVKIQGDLANSTDSDVRISPGDTIMVSKAGLVYVLGAVRVPGGYVIASENTVTVLRALALAQGNNPEASMKDARIVRKESSGLKEIPVDLAKIERAKAPDVAMQSNDILFVPSSFARGFGRQSAESTVYAASQAVVFRTQ